MTPCPFCGAQVDTDDTRYLTQDGEFTTCGACDSTVAIGLEERPTHRVSGVFELPDPHDAQSGIHVPGRLRPTELEALAADGGDPEGV